MILFFVNFGEYI